MKIINKIFWWYGSKKYEELEHKYHQALVKILEQNEEIKNLKLRLVQLTNKGEIKWK